MQLPPSSAISWTFEPEDAVRSVQISIDIPPSAETPREKTANEQTAKIIFLNMIIC